MGFSDGRFSIWIGKRARSLTPLESPHASNLPRPLHWRRQREKRFHRPPQALGYGYEQYYPINPETRPTVDLSQQPASVLPPVLAVSETEVESALQSEIEKIQRTSLSGVQICLLILLLVSAV